MYYMQVIANAHLLYNILYNKKLPLVFSLCYFF